MTKNSDGVRAGGVSERLWNDCKDLALQCLHHPFVTGLGSGKLRREAFLHYVTQDAHYLRHFAASYAAAIDKCPPGDAAAHAALHKMLLGVHRELRVHGNYAQQYGVDLTGAIVPNPATLAYTSFLAELGACPEAGMVDILAAMTPCARLYGWLGACLARAYPDHDAHEYRGWVKTYSSEAYMECPDVKEEIVDRLAAGVEYDRLLRIYRKAMQLELDFFSAVPDVAPPRRVGLLVVDFDDTCSQRDTIGALMGVAADCAAQRAATPEAGEATRAGLQARIRQLGESYSARLQELLQDMLPPQGAGGLGGEPEFDMEVIAGFLDKLSDFDQSMNQVVVDSGVLAGIDLDSLRAAGAAVALRPGCREALARSVARGVPTHVLTVNWSGAFVAAALGLPARVASGMDAFAEGDAASPGLVIHSNELEVDAGSGVTTGDISRAIENARDKGALFEQLLLECAASEGEAGGAAEAAGGRPLAVYVGDSVSDVLPLLAADVGVVMGSNPLLRRVAAEFGIRLAPLCAAPRGGDASTVAACDGTAPPVLYEASGWPEVEAFLFGRQSGAPAPLPPVITVAGSDSGGGAGIQADLKTFLACGVFGMSAVTAVTAQNTRGVQSVHALPLPLLAAQLDSVLGDLGAAALKTGMLPSAEAVRLVASKVADYGVPNVVVDPVMVSTSGDCLAGSEVAAALVAHLLPLAAVVTPNLAEASALLGGAQMETLEDMKEAARRLQRLGARCALVKGGHLAAQQAAAGVHASSILAVDVLCDEAGVLELRAPYVDTRNLHGTGCTLASAIAAHLARGATPRDAVVAAKRYLTDALAASAALRLGGGPQRPFNHAPSSFRAAATPASADAAGSAAGPVSSTPSGSAGGPPTGGSGSSSSSSGSSSDGIGAAVDVMAPVAAGGAAAGGARRRSGGSAFNSADLRVYGVTDRGCNSAAGRSLAEAVAAAVAGGVTVVQLREKDADGCDFVAAACSVIQVCRPLGVPVLINDRVDVALASGADGAHVGQSDIPARAARAMLGPDRILGVSVKTVDEAVKAVADGADYLGAGAVFPTSTKDSSVIGLDTLAEVCGAVDVPVVSIGGVSTANAASTIAAGCEGVAVVSAVFAAPDAAGAAAELRRVVDAALAERASRGADIPAVVAAAGLAC